MAHLYIFTNDHIWSDTEENRSYGHLGTCDRDNPSVRYDRPGKTSVLLATTQQLAGEHARNTTKTPISITTSDRIPEMEILLQGHPKSYLAQLEEASIAARERVDRGQPAIAPFGREADASPGTYRAALSSVGAALDTIDQALKDPTTTAFALVWPPGHHAEPSQAMGFCYLSTAALAALYGRDHGARVHPPRNNRVALIDIDHHRGNGSAAVLANQPDILFIDQVYRSSYDEKTMRYTDGSLNEATGHYSGAGKEYPYSRDDASIGAVAHPSIEASNILHLQHEGFQRPDTLIDRFVGEALPRLKDFQPDLIIWSVGLDSAVGDPLGGLGMTPDTFYIFIKGVREALPSARHCGVLEGGYDPLISAPCLKTTLLGLSDSGEEASVPSATTHVRRFTTSA